MPFKNSRRLKPIARCELAEAYMPTEPTINPASPSTCAPTSAFQDMGILDVVMDDIQDRNISGAHLHHALPVTIIILMNH
jgi:hypothetical protein